MDITRHFTYQESKDYELLKTNEERRQFCQWKFQTDFKLFVYLLGYRDTGKLHDKLIESIGKFRVVGNNSIRRIWLWARGFFKTSLVTEAHTVWLIVNNPNIRILMVSYSLDVAKKPYAAVRNHFIGNEEFRYFFCEFCPEANKEGKIDFGTTEAFTIPNRRKNFKEPTLMCVGVGTNVTGLHFDVMKVDDLVNQASVSNDTQIQASKDYYSLLRPLFDNPTIPREDIVGTIYHFNDLHCELQKNTGFEQSFIPARDWETGEFNFPERLNEKGWEELINDPTVNPYDIQRQWLLRPTNPKDAKFKGEWWKEYESLPDGLAEYICVDPASTQKKKSDYTVIQRWGVDAGGKHYLLEGLRDKLTVFQRIDKVVEFARRSKRLVVVKYEVLGGRHGDLETLKKRFLDERMPIIPQETKSTTSGKKDRIEQRLVGQFNAGQIFFPKVYMYRSEYDGKVYDFVQVYKLEYLQFPYTEHDDILDCHSQMFEEPKMLIKGLALKAEDKKEWGTGDDWENLYKSIDYVRRQNPFLNREQALMKYRLQQVKQLMRSR